MTVLEELKTEAEKMKNMSIPQRIDYIVYYHKTGILMTIFIVILIGVAVFNALVDREEALYVVMIDCISDKKSEGNVTPYEKSLAEQLGINTGTHMVVLDNDHVLSYADTAEEATYQLGERAFVRLVAEKVHVFMAQEATINERVMNDPFMDLREVMTPEQYEYYKDSLYWIDYDILKNYEFEIDAEKYVYDEDHRSPEGMKEPIPVGVYLTPCEEFQENYTFLYAQEIVYCFPYMKDDENAEYNGTEKALAFLDILAGRTGVE